MNYIEQLNAFYTMLDYNALSSNAIALYNYLLHIAYTLDCINEFSVANITIMSKLRLTIKELQNARNELINKKYINYKKGRNQNMAPKYQIINNCQNTYIKLGQPERQPKGYTDGQADGQAEGTTEGHIITILNLYFIYILNKGESNFQNISADDKKAIINIMKKLRLYIENTEVLEYMTENEQLELKLKYWSIKEIYFSPYRVFLNNLTCERFTFRFLKAKKYCGLDNLYKFLNYFIKCVQEDFYKNKKEKESEKDANIKQSS